MTENVESLVQHLIVCGDGMTAQRIVAELQGYLDADGKQLDVGTGIVPREYVVITRTRERGEELLRAFPNLRYVVGDATSDAVLREAGVEHAFGIFPVLNADKDNLFITFTVKQMNPSIRVIARCSDIFHTGRKLMVAGANKAISPTFIGGLRLISETVRPAVTDFLDELMQGKASLEEILVAPTLAMCGKTLAELAINKEYHLLVVAVRRGGGAQYDYNPPAQYRVEAGDVLVLFGKNDDMRALLQHMEE